MNRSQLHDFFDRRAGMREAKFEGKCHDCGSDVVVSIKLVDEGFDVSGGALYQPFLNDDAKLWVKCTPCFGGNPHLSNYQECEVFVRCIGYLRPTNQMNEGKRAEVKDRKMFNVAG